MKAPCPANKDRSARQLLAFQAHRTGAERRQFCVWGHGFRREWRAADDSACGVKLGGVPRPYRLVALRSGDSCLQARGVRFWWDASCKAPSPEILPAGKIYLSNEELLGSCLQARRILGAGFDQERGGAAILPAGKILWRHASMGCSCLQARTSLPGPNVDAETATPLSSNRSCLRARGTAGRCHAATARHLLILPAGKISGAAWQPPCPVRHMQGAQQCTAIGTGTAPYEFLPAGKKVQFSTVLGDSCLQARAEMRYAPGLFTLAGDLPAGKIGLAHFPASASCVCTSSADVRPALDGRRGTVMPSGQIARPSFGLADVFLAGKPWADSLGKAESCLQARFDLTCADSTPNAHPSVCGSFGDKQEIAVHAALESSNGAAQSCLQARGTGAPVAQGLISAHSRGNQHREASIERLSTCHWPHLDSIAFHPRQALAWATAKKKDCAPLRREFSLAAGEVSKGPPRAALLVHGAFRPWEGTLGSRNRRGAH